MKKKILIFDDDKDVLQLSTTIFNKSGYEVETKEDCNGLLHVVGEYKPDVIIVDHQMPGMTGVEAITILKEDEELKNIPVIFYSSMNELAETAKKIHADAYLQKPASTDLLLKIVSDMVNGQ